MYNKCFHFSKWNLFDRETNLWVFKQEENCFSSISSTLFLLCKRFILMEFSPGHCACPSTFRLLQMFFVLLEQCPVCAAAPYIFNQAVALQAHVQKILSNQILNRKLLVWLHIRKPFLPLLLQIGSLGLHYQMVNSVAESPLLILAYKYQMMIYYQALAMQQEQILFNLFNLERNGK